MLIVKTYRTTAFHNTTTYRTKKIEAQFDTEEKENIDRNETPMINFEDANTGTWWSIPIEFVISITEE